MDPEEKKFGRGPRELTGAVDLVSHFKLLPHHEFFCKRSLPLSILDSHYLHNVVGDTEIRKGDGMQLDQLIIQNTSQSRDCNSRIKPFDIGSLKDAFQLGESIQVELPVAEKGVPTFLRKSKSESKDKDKKHKKHKDREKGKDREHKKHKHRHKDRNEDEEKKKRKHEGDGDKNNHGHKKSKHKSSKIDGLGSMMVAR